MGGIATITAPLLAASFALDGGTPANVTDRMRLTLVTGGSFVVTSAAASYVGPRIASPESGDMAQLSTVFHEWGNDHLLFPGNPDEFDTVTDTSPGTSTAPGYNLTTDELLLRRSQLSGGGYEVGLRHYFEEGLFRLHHPFTGPISFGHHNATLTRGKLFLVDAGGGQLMFRWQQTNAAGDSVLTYDFDELPIDIEELSEVNFAKPTYYHFRREYDSVGDQMVMELTVNTGTPQQHTQAGLYTPSGGSGHFWGRSLPIFGGGDRLAFHYWHRSGWANTQQSGTVGNSPWDNPRVFDAVSVFQAHGDYSNGWLDSGVDASYWATISLPLAFNLWGSNLELRAVGSDDPPRTSLSGSWAGLDWIPVTGGSIDLEDAISGYPQGRYLLLQFRFTSSTTAPLNGYSSAIPSSATHPAVSAVWSEDSPAPLVATPIAVGGEGQAVETLPVDPQYSFEVGHRRAVARWSLGSYSQSVSRSTKTRREWEAGYTAITGAEKESVDQFFRARSAGVEAFYWTPEDLDAPVKAALADPNVEYQRLAPDVWAASFELREVL